MKEIHLGRLPFFGGLRVSLLPSALAGFFVMWGLLWAAGMYWLRLGMGTTLALALAATVLHWLSEFMHQLGHAWAAQRSGYPMTGIRFWDILASSLYPQDEPGLPGRVHILRALGGPAMSACISLLAGIAAVSTPRYDLYWYLAMFASIENLFVFTLQVFLPLGFNDGSTILHWINKKS
jgi:hypothetical protein